MWPWILMDDLEKKIKKIGHLICTTSIVHDFKPSGEFKVGVQSGNSQFESKLARFCPVWPWNLMDDLEKTIGRMFYATSSFVNHRKAIGEFKLEWQSRNSSKSAIFDLVTLKFDGWPRKTIGHLFYASFHSHLWIQTGVTVQKIPIWVKIDIFFALAVTFKFYGWPWKIIGQLFSATSNFMHHFLVICEFKLEIQSETSNLCPNRWFFLAVWPWNLTDDLEINRAPLLNNTKHCASFHHHMWNQTGVMVRKRLSWVLISVTLTFAAKQFFKKINEYIFPKDGNIADLKNSEQNPISVKKESKRLQDPKWKSRMCSTIFYNFISNPCTMHVPIKYTNSQHV